MIAAIGRTCWAIPEGFIPSGSLPGADRPLLSHEAACILNAGEQDAQVEIMLYFVDRKPVGPYRVTIGAERTLHLRFNELTDPEPVPRDTDYASVLTSDVAIVVSIPASTRVARRSRSCRRSRSRAKRSCGRSAEQLSDCYDRRSASPPRRGGRSARTGLGW